MRHLKGPFLCLLSALIVFSLLPSLAFAEEGENEPQTLSIHAWVNGGGGSITPSGTIPVSDMDAQTFNIEPNPGYAIASVKVDGEEQGPISFYTFWEGTGGTIEVTFALIEAPSENSGANNGPSAPPADVVAVQASPIMVPNTGEQNASFLFAIPCAAAAVLLAAMALRRRRER